MAGACFVVRRWALVSLAVVSLGLAGSGCGDDTVGAGGEGGKSDGKFHPAKTGVAVDESEACDTLHDAVTKQQTALGNCTMTVPLCPNFVRTMSGKQCAKYDQGTVNGCAGYYGQATDCMDLSSRSQGCVVEIIEGSEQTGCPTP